MTRAEPGDCEWIDRHGNSHHVSLSLVEAERLERELRIDLPGCLTHPEKLQEIYQRLHEQPSLVVGALAVIEDDQDPDDFAALFDGDALVSGTEALLFGIANFFPRRQRTVMVNLLMRCREAAETMSEKGLQAAIELMKSPEFLSGISESVTHGSGSSG